MDTIRPELVDDQRALDIFSRVRARLSAELIKTDEKYIALLIEEINNYFADMSTSIIDTTNLPDYRTGAMVNTHNKLLSNVTSDIDKVHNKRIQVQDMLTKAFNFLDTERTTLDTAVSKMYSRVVNQMMRSSLNDRNVTIFSEYFTDNTFMDPTLSTKMQIDPSVCALTLSTVSENLDNSKMIDPTSIFIQVKLNNAVQDIASSLYPITSDVTSVNDQQSYASFGRTLDTVGFTTTNINLNDASAIDNTRYVNIQSQCLVNDSPNSESTATYGEFELIFNDFNSGSIDASILDGIRKSNLNTTKYPLDAQHVLIDETNGFSFNGAYNVPKHATDNVSLKRLIGSMGLKFKLNAGASVNGFLSYISINFSPADVHLTIPKINYATSYMKDINGSLWYSFTEMDSNTVSTGTTTVRSLLLDKLVVNPVEFYIDFDLTSMTPTQISAYMGVCWMIELAGTTVNGNYNIGDTNLATVNASSQRFLFVYHDINRYNTPPSDTNNDLNYKALSNIISMYQNNLKKS